MEREAPRDGNAGGPQCEWVYRSQVLRRTVHPAVHTVQPVQSAATAATAAVQLRRVPALPQP